MTRTILFLASVAAFAQSTGGPAFEVASIKRHTAQDFAGRFETLPGGRFHVTNDSVRNLVERAYDLKSYQVTGGPGWITSDRYDIEAKAGPDATKEQVRQMLQNLLADRFQLKVRQETKEFQVYVLLAAKGGPKIHALKEGEGGNCGSGFDREGYFGCKVSMAYFASAFEGQLNRPVLNQTGLDGVFDLKLHYDQYTLANKTPPPDFDQPPLFTAIQDQLGLKLDAQKTKLPVLVIESIERPTEN